MSSLKVFSITFFLMTSSVVAQSAIESGKSQGVAAEKLTVFQMRRKIDDQVKLIKKLSREVNDVEITLVMNNKKYLKLAEERAYIEDQLQKAKKNADYDSETLKKSYDQTKSILMGVLLNRLENTENSSDLLARKILVESLQKKIKELEAIMSSNDEVKQSADELHAKLKESMDTERELLTLMGDLEQKKISLKGTIESATSEQIELEDRFKTEKNQLAMREKSEAQVKKRNELAAIQTTEVIKIPSQNSKEGEYYPPIYAYQGLEYQKKGVTFNFQGKSEVRATKGGKIVYTGALANYGNVVMIDHGNDTRSVLLGQFNYVVKNGDVVKDAQLLGHTTPSQNSGLGEGKIYFEVRKKNLAQNTYLLLDKNSLAKNSSN